MSKISHFELRVRVYPTESSQKKPTPKKQAISALSAKIKQYSHCSINNIGGQANFRGNILASIYVHLYVILQVVLHLPKVVDTECHISGIHDSGAIAHLELNDLEILGKLFSYYF